MSFQSTAISLSVGWELWYPYQYHNKQQQLVGLDFEIFNAIVDDADLDVTYTELPWKRHVQYIRTGEMDVAMGSSFTEERDKFAYFSIPYRQEVVKLFVKKGSVDKIKLNSLSELTTSNFMIGVEGGYYYGQKYQELIQDIKFQARISEVVDLEENVTMLMKGYIDGFLVDPITMKAFTEKYRLHDEFETHPIEIYQSDIHIMLSKASCTPNIKEKIDQTISKLKANGTLDKIINRWTHIQSQ